MSKLDKEEVKKLFKRFDNGNGHLSLAELDRAIIQYYPQLASNKQAIMRAYKAADASGNGWIELKEFSVIMEFLQRYNELYAVFDQLDTNDDHRITFAEFKKGFDLIGEDTSDEKFLRREFDKVDTNKGGFILFDEFCMYMATRNAR